MLSGIRSRLTYANIMSTVGVFIALGGVSYAAVTLPKNSVGPAQVKSNAVTGSKVKNSSLGGWDVKNGSLRGGDVKNGSLTGGDVKDGSLTAKDFNGPIQGVQGPAGALGPAGAQGPKGDTGAKGDMGASGATDVVVRRKDFGSLAAGAFATHFAMCQPGERATGGGGGFDGNGGNEIIQQSYPVKDGFGQRAEDGDTPVGWRVFIKNANGTAFDFIIYVVCARP